MKRKELTKTSMMISSGKNPFGHHFFIEKKSALQGLMMGTRAGVTAGIVLNPSGLCPVMLI